MISSEATKNAKWIWYDNHPGYDLINSWMQARRTFYLKDIPANTLICVTADTQYRFYVNGKHVNRGPARGFQISWPYDTVDITPFLKKGKNVIAAIVHNTGISTFQYIHQGYAGFLLVGKVGTENISANLEWRVRPAPGFKRVTTRVSIQLGFQEFFDASMDDDSWLFPSYDDSDWSRPYCMSVGSMPWHSLQEREIPLLRESVIIPQKLVSETVGRCKKDYEEITDVVSLFLREKKEWRKPTQTFKKSNIGAVFSIPPTGAGNYRAYCIDFGKETVGSLRIAAEGGDGKEIIDTLICEGKEELSPIIRSPEEGCRIAFGNRLFLRAGKTEHEQFDYWGFRYLVIVVRNSRKKLKIRIRLHAVGYPLEVKGKFQSSNEKLNKIYEISSWTQQCCMLDAYVDCPWREQAQYWGDAKIQAQNTFYLSADTKLFKRGIKQIGIQEIPNGLTYAYAPAAWHRCILPDFTLTWIITHWDYYWQTGELSLFKQMTERIHRAFNYFFHMTDKNGLLVCDDRYWLFLDWSPIFKKSYSTLYNLFYLMALRKVIKLFELIDDRKSAQLYARREKTLGMAIERKLFDNKTKKFYGGLSWDNQPIAEDTPHVYSFAILLDLFPEYHQIFLQEHLLPLIERAYPSIKKYDDDVSSVNFEVPDVPGLPSPFFMFYIFQALKKCGCMKEVISCIEQWWGAMVEKDLSTTEEFWDAKPGMQSLCHAWSAHPIVHLSNILLGVWQKSSGWKEIYFSPAFTCVNYVKGRIATPRGIIESGWKKTKSGTKIYLNLPPEITAEVILPPRKKEIRKGINGKWIIFQ